MDEDAILVIMQAERIIYREAWRMLEERALQGLARTRGLCRAPLETRSDVIQLVTYDGEHIGHIRCDRTASSAGAWVAVPQPPGRPIGAYNNEEEAAEAVARASGKLTPGTPGCHET
jgi:hypothetical protein